MVAPNGTFSVYDVTASPYNAARDGSTDDTTAIQTAIDNCAAEDGGIVWIPPGNYLINGVLSGDTYRSQTMRDGLTIPEIAGIGNDPILGHVQIVGGGKSTRLILGNNNMYGIRISTNYADVRDLTIVGSTNMTSSPEWTKYQIGLAIAAPDLQDTTTRFRGSWNSIERIAMHNLRIGIHMISAGTASSDMYRNMFYNCAVRECGIGIYLEDNPDGAASTVTAINRNKFFGIDVNQAHVGLMIESGDTNSFVHFEPNNISTTGPGTPIVNSGTPTGIYMLQKGATNNRATVSNWFWNIPNESNDRDIYLADLCTQNGFYGFLSHNDTSRIPDTGTAWNYFVDRKGIMTIPPRTTFYHNDPGWTAPWLKKSGLTGYNYTEDELWVVNSAGAWQALATGATPDSKFDQFTTAARDLIVSPPIGRSIWNTTTSQPEVWNGTTWEEILDTDGKFRTT